MFSVPAVTTDAPEETLNTAFRLSLKPSFSALFVTPSVPLAKDWPSRIGASASTEPLKSEPPARRYTRPLTSKLWSVPVETALNPLVPAPSVS